VVHHYESQISPTFARRPFAKNKRSSSREECSLPAAARRRARRCFTVL